MSTKSTKTVQVNDKKFSTKINDFNLLTQTFAPSAKSLHITLSGYVKFDIERYQDYKNARTIFQRKIKKQCFKIARNVYPNCSGTNFISIVSLNEHNQQYSWDKFIFFDVDVVIYFDHLQRIKGATYTDPIVQFGAELLHYINQSYNIQPKKKSDPISIDVA